MPPARILAGLGPAVAVALAGAGMAEAASARTSHAKLFQSASHKVTCGIEIHAGAAKATWIICSAKGLPRPKGGGGVGDPFVQLKHTGKPQLVLRSQDSFVGSKPATLHVGQRWSALGVTCQVDTDTVACFNVSGHGFNIGNGSYRQF
jgi:hypothetical protein